MSLYIQRLLQHRLEVKSKIRTPHPLLPRILILSCYSSSSSSLPSCCSFNYSSYSSISASSYFPLCIPFYCSSSSSSYSSSCPNSLLLFLFLLFLFSVFPLTVCLIPPPLLLLLLFPLYLFHSTVSLPPPPPIHIPSFPELT